MPMKVFVTLCGSMVAVADNSKTAENQVRDILSSSAAHLVDSAIQHGESRDVVRMRIAYVEVNQ